VVKRFSCYRAYRITWFGLDRRVESDGSVQQECRIIDLLLWDDPQLLMV